MTPQLRKGMIFVSKLLHSLASGNEFSTQKSIHIDNFISKYHPQIAEYTAELVVIGCVWS
jgi:hypothetical protein